MRFAHVMGLFIVATSPGTGQAFTFRALSAGVRVAGGIERTSRAPSAFRGRADNPPMRGGPLCLQDVFGEVENDVESRKTLPAFGVTTHGQDISGTAKGPDIHLEDSPPVEDLVSRTTTSSATEAAPSFISAEYQRPSAIEGQYGDRSGVHTLGLQSTMYGIGAVNDHCDGYIQDAMDASVAQVFYDAFSGRGRLKAFYQTADGSPGTGKGEANDTIPRKAPGNNQSNHNDGDAASPGKHRKRGRFAGWWRSLRRHGH